MNAKALVRQWIREDEEYDGPYGKIALASIRKEYFKEARALVKRLEKEKP